MNEEISDLFETLIVSKIKKEMEELKEKMEQLSEESENISNNIEKLPKNSSISLLEEKLKEQYENVVDEMNHTIKKQQTEKYLRDIVEFLKQQYEFEDQNTLANFLEQKTSGILSKMDEELAFSEKMCHASKEADKKIDGLPEAVYRKFAVGSHQPFGEFVEDKLKYIAAKAEQNASAAGDIGNILKDLQNENLELKEQTESNQRTLEELVQKNQRLQDTIGQNQEAFCVYRCRMNKALYFLAGNSFILLIGMLVLIFMK